MSGAAITEDGRIYSWGYNLYGGNTPATSSANVGATQVTGLPDPSIEGNMPIYLKGGYQTYWVMLENGDIWYFGGRNEYERPEGDEPTDISGTTRLGKSDLTPDMTPTKEANRRPVRAMQSVGLDSWTRRNSPNEYIVQIVSGIWFGAALLYPSGRVLTWGSDGGPAGALGRTCGDTSAKPSPLHCSTAKAEDLAHSPGFAEQVPPFVSLEATFTAIRGLTANGELWGWSAKSLAYCGDIFPQGCDYTGIPRWPPVKLAEQVQWVQAGQGYLIWQTYDGSYHGQGYNPAGSLGHTAFNGASHMNNATVRDLVFFPKDNWDDSRTSLNKQITNGTTRMFTLTECFEGLCG
jgi:alpha-tubulin suppressor-like RCC1 family protein